MIALSHFLHMLRQNDTRSRHTTLVEYLSVQTHRHNFTLKTFEQFGALDAKPR